MPKPIDDASYQDDPPVRHARSQIERLEDAHHSVDQRPQRDDQREHGHRCQRARNGLSDLFDFDVDIPAITNEYAVPRDRVTRRATRCRSGMHAQCSGAPPPTHSRGRSLRVT